MKAGDVFRLVKGADRHAKVIISDPVRFPEVVLFVGMTSFDPKEDHTCIIFKGEHSTCTVPRTCITYSRSKASGSNAEFDKMVKAKLIEVYEPVSNNLLARIRTGAMQSPRMPKGFKKLLVDQGLVRDPEAESQDKTNDDNGGAAAATQ